MWLLRCHFISQSAAGASRLNAGTGEELVKAATEKPHPGVGRERERCEGERGRLAGGEGGVERRGGGGGAGAEQWGTSKL